MSTIASHITFNCSKSIIETSQKVWDMFKVNNKSRRPSGVFIVDFEQENVIWKRNGKKRVILQKIFIWRNNAEKESRVFVNVV